MKQPKPQYLSDDVRLFDDDRPQRDLRPGEYEVLIQKTDHAYFAIFDHVETAEADMAKRQRFYNESKMGDEIKSFQIVRRYHA